jgi:hypothetical protein
VIGAPFNINTQQEALFLEKTLASMKNTGIMDGIMLFQALYPSAFGICRGASLKLLLKRYPQLFAKVIRVKLT